MSSRHPSVRAVAATVAAADEARRLRCDATAVVERMAVEARRAGVAHPVAAALARSARMSHLAGLEAFARYLGLPVEHLRAAEEGVVRFGELPRVYDAVIGGLGIDLLSLADLEAQWRTPAPAPPARA